MESSAQSSPQVVSVVLDAPIDRVLDYSAPPELQEKLTRGVQVEVPLRGKICRGYVHALKKESESKRLLPLHAVLTEFPLIPSELYELALWISRYYCSPLSKVIKLMLPVSIRQNMGHLTQYCIVRNKSKEILRDACIKLRETHPQQAKVLEAILVMNKEMLLTELLEKTGVSRSPVDSLQKRGFITVTPLKIERSPLANQEYFQTPPKKLNSEQKGAFETIKHSLEKSTFKPILLHGVTGSGKTEVYLQAIDYALRLKKGVIMLVPEISLTTQTIEQFRSRFDQNIAILHHRLSQGERHDEWHRIRKGEASIVIGARSAIFSPVRDLGLIIVDEEHDGAYKQNDETPCYHARDVAVIRAKMQNCVVVLGSATPSMESYLNVERGKYHLCTLSHRVSKAKLPHVSIIDMKKEYEKKQGHALFSDPLISKIKTRLDAGEQTILFLNRRGYHTSLHCKRCATIFQCPQCSIALTFHRGDNVLCCHLCDTRLSPPPRVCSQCGSSEMLKYQGVGTEQVERALHALFPEIRTLRMDGDTTKHKGSHDRLFRAFSTGKSDVLIGTQMVAKGLHFPSVTLVAILNCDGGLHIPDFRASERVFQLITQVAGRAGRGELSGEVILQTHMPENAIIQFAAAQDFFSFFAHEKEARNLFDFPPFSHLVKLTFSGEDPGLTLDVAQQMRNRMVTSLHKNFSIHPCVPCGHPKIKNIYRFQFLIKGPSILPLSSHLFALQKEAFSLNAIRLQIDVDPLSTFF